MYVYKITNKINEKIYIGITNNPERRWANECSMPKNPQVINLAINKYGKENFTFEILERNLSIEESNYKEIFYIQKYNSLVPNGYNVSPGGGRYNYEIGRALGEKNANAKITDIEAQYILDNRNQPMYVLYEEFSDKIGYDEFKAIYLNQKFSHLKTNTPIYPFNFEFSNQFTSGNKLEYDEVKEIREEYAKGTYWETVYQKFKERYPDKWTFWNIYYGNRYKLVMPEVFTIENKKKHSSLGKSGEKNHKAKLKETDVLLIRKLYSEGISLDTLCTMYPQVVRTSIRNIIQGKTWKNLL